MSKVIFSPFYKSHPVFKADQVLSDVHLNGMLEYLEKENTQTRSQLIGSGILEGFAFQSEQTAEASTITITSGKGVTSSGQLIIQEHESGSISFSKAIKYEAQHLPLEFQNLPQGSVIYALIPDSSDTPEGTEGVESLASLLAEDVDTGLAALQESVDIQIQSCFITSCDERGSQRKFTIKYLLIQVPGSFTSGPSEYEPTLKRIKRIQFEASNNPLLLQAYENACNDEYLDWLLKEIRDVQTHIIPGLREFVPVQDIPVNTLNIKSKRTLAKESKPGHIQYFYDFLTDTGITAVEIIQRYQRLKSRLYPLTGNHPHHLMLGQINGQEPAFNRNYFQPVLTDRHELEPFRELASLCNRLGFMLSTYHLPEKNKEIQIRATNSHRFPFETRAIPFYYNRQNGPGNNQPGLSLPDSIDYFHDDKDALLVEGLIGLTKKEALDALKELISSHHLAIGLVALRVSKTAHSKPYPLPEKPEPGSVSEFNFKEFAIEHPGLYHGSSVPKGGTLAVIFSAEPGNTDGQVVGTLVLPYICCGRKQAAPDPKPFVLKATGDQAKVLTDKSLDIKVLDNDQFDKDSPIEVDFVYDLTATHDQEQVITGKQIDINSLKNDFYDRDSPLEVDLIDELDARNVETGTLTNKSIDIDVLKNDNIGPGPIELDFDKDN